MDIRLTLFKTLVQGLPPGRLLDLGTGHGKFAMLAQQLGWDVTAVDARTERLPKVPAIRWIQEDVRTFTIERYDCICILGLLYHLEIGDQLALLKKCAGTRTIIDTHVALKVTHEEQGYQGTLFAEKLDQPTASWGNVSSFWPTEESLARMIHDAGFTTVLKLLPPYLKDRTFYVCL